VIPNITRGGRMAGVMAYLAGPGRDGGEVHTEPHLVAGDPAIMAWHDDAELDRDAALQIAAELDRPRKTFGVQVTTAVKTNDGHKRLDEDGKAVRRDAHVWHCSLSLPATDGALSDERWAAISDEFVARMGFADPASGEAPCRWVAVRHGASQGGNDHVHLVVGLVREDGTKADVWNDRINAQNVAGELERKYGLEVLASREAGAGAMRGEKPGERERAERQGDPEVAREQLARIVRGCAAAAGDEAEFVRRVRAADDNRVLIRPRYAAGAGDTVVVGYSAARRPPPAPRLADGSTDKRRAPVWYGGGHLARDLTLPRLRAEWPDTPGHATAAIAEWRAAKRHQPPVRPGVETRTPDPDTWARYTSEVAALRERLRSVPIDDRALWAHIARDTAGAFAAWSQAVEVTPGPLADTARVLARCAQLPAHQARPRPAGLPSARGAALVLAAVAQPANKTLAHTVLSRQLANTVKALHDARRAAGDARAADAIRAVVTQRLMTVHAALPAEPKTPPPRVVVEDAEAAEAVRIASQGQLPFRAPGPPAPGTLDAARPSPERHPGVRQPDKTEIER